MIGERVGGLAGRQSRTALCVVADDLGRTSGVNRGIARAYDEGILSAASLMASGEAFDEAVEIARARPRLSVGWHVTLCDGRPALGPDSPLAGPDGAFEGDPARAGWRYFRDRRRLRPVLAAELEAQLDRLVAAGVRPTHLDGHHHLHMHPVIFDLAVRLAARRGIRWVRIPCEPFATVLGRSARGAFVFLEWWILGLLAGRNRRRARAQGLAWGRPCYGLSTTGALDERYVLGVLRELGSGLSELFCHPDVDTDAGRTELAALTSPRVRDRVRALGVFVVGYPAPAGSPAPEMGTGEPG